MKKQNIILQLITRIMKQYLLAILLFTSIGIKAQLPVFKVDCGNDTFSCLGLYPKTDTFHIGTHIKITNGTPPYIYTWSCKPYKVTSHFTSTASYYLSDTSISVTLYIISIFSINIYSLTT